MISNLSKYWVTRITGKYPVEEFGGRGLRAASRLNIIDEFEDEINYTDAFKETLKLIVENEDFYEIINNYYASTAGEYKDEIERFAAALVLFHVVRLNLECEDRERHVLLSIDLFQRLFQSDIEPSHTEEDIPPEFQCSRCGYCCKMYGAELSFDEGDIEMWFDKGLLWVYYHPFIDWSLNEFLAPNNGVYGGVYSVKDARKLLAEKELECENDRRTEWEIDLKEFGSEEEFGDEEIDWKPEPFPWGGTMRYCTMLKWMGNKWGCLIHEYKSKICREYLCYWERLKAFFTDRQAHYPYAPVYFRLDE